MVGKGAVILCKFCSVECQLALTGGERAQRECAVCSQLKERMSFVGRLEATITGLRQEIRERDATIKRLERGNEAMLRIVRCSNGLMPWVSSAARFGQNNNYTTACGALVEAFKSAYPDDLDRWLTRSKEPYHNGA